jgi:hypothetical protein
MQSLFGFASTAEIEIALSEENSRQMIGKKGEVNSRYPLYFDGESISGKVFTINRS